MPFKYCHNTNPNSSAVLLGTPHTHFTSNFSNWEESWKMHIIQPHSIECLHQWLFWVELSKGSQSWIKLKLEIQTFNYWEPLPQAELECPSKDACTELGSAMAQSLQHTFSGQQTVHSKEPVPTLHLWLLGLCNFWVSLTHPPCTRTFVLHFSLVYFLLGWSKSLLFLAITWTG